MCRKKFMIPRAVFHEYRTTFDFHYLWQEWNIIREQMVTVR